jgi:protein-disulfide isomerase
MRRTIARPQNSASVEKVMRLILASVAAWIALVLFPPLGVSAQPADPAAIAAALQAPQALPDEWLGRADAPVTIIEYASLNCGHCASFEQTVLPELKAKYIDTGRVRFVMRDDPINPRSLDAAKLARCAGLKRADVIDLLSARVKEWALDDDSRKLTAIVTAAQFLTPAAAAACLKDPALAAAFERQRNAEEPLNMGVVPVFFVNGTRYESDLPMAAVENLVPAAAPPAPIVAQAPSAAPTPAAQDGFQVIGACDLVAAHDAAASPAIHAVDDQIAALALANLKVVSALRGFAAACRALPHLQSEGAAKDRFVERTYELGIFRGRVFDKAAALRTLLKNEPLASLSRRGTKDKADYCAFTIATASGEVLKQADALLKSAEIDCPAVARQ